MATARQRSLLPHSLVCVISLLLLASAEARSVDRPIQIMNQTGRKVELYWMKPNSKERMLQSTPHIFNGATMSLNSFVGHSFELREVPSSKTGECGDAASKVKTCRTGYFTVNENDDQLVTVWKTPEALEVEHVDNKSMARAEALDLLRLCKQQALEAIDGSSPEIATGAIDDLVSCVEASVASTLEKSNEEIAFQANVRTKMGDLLENYTCADHELNATEEIQTKQWLHHGVRRQVKIMHDRPSSKVHVLKNFISEAECRAMEDAARPLLHKATVADGKGGSEYSPSRKAMQAGIKVPWEQEKEGNHIAVLSRRVYDYANHVLGLGLEENGQEDLMSIQYFGRGEDDDEPDRYMPHCDGECTGQQHKTGNRMATMVMYCTVPEVGGATRFRNSGLHITPEAGSATFFSYIDPETRRMDSGFTEHSGCPVVQGEKKIVTQWIRLGVDDANPWDSFNTLGVKYSDEDP